MAAGLYDPAYEHDACGVGMVADLHGTPDHDIVDKALTVLEHLAHRGASGAEVETGDGAGILTQVPHRFLVGAAEAAGFTLPGGRRLRRGPGVPAHRRRRRAQGARRGGAARRRGGPGGARVARHADRAARARQDGARGHAAHRAALRGPGRGRRRHDGAGAPRLRAAQAGRARRGRPLLPVALGADDRLQGHAHLRAAARVLPRPARPGVRVRPGAGALTLLDQHVPQLAAGAPVPLRLPQRRDQHGAGQPQLDAGPRGAAVDVADRGRPVARLPDLHAGRERLGQLRRGARAPASRRALAAARRAHDDPRGVGEPLAHGPRAARLLPLPRVAHGAVGRPGRHLVHRRHRGGRGARPQRPAPVALLGHRRRPGRARQRGGRARHRARARRAQGPPAAGPHVPRRHVEGPPRRGRGDQGRAGVGAPLRAVAVDRPGPPRGAPGPHDAHAPARARRHATAASSATPTRSCA